MDDEAYLIAYFGKSPPWERHGLCKADVVLALLRDDRLEAAASVAGRPVKKLADDPRLSPKPYPMAAASRRIVAVKILRQTRKQLLFKVGLTEDQLKARGLTRRDIRHAERRGYVEFSS